MKEILASVAVALQVTSVTALALLVFECRSFAAESDAAADKPTTQQAYQQLLSTQFFAFGGVGYAGTTSEGERAFRIIVASTNALKLFKAALTNGKSEAKLYALCGIRKLAPTTFEAHAKTLIAANPKVMTMSGCMAMDERASNIVARIASGFYDHYIGGRKR